MRGALFIEGTWAGGLSFRHADGSTYGAPASPTVAVMLGDVHLALTRLGYKEREARERVDHIRPHVGAEMNVIDAVRLALQVRAGAPA